jgi:hypothetical protein
MKLRPALPTDRSPMVLALRRHPLSVWASESPLPTSPPKSRAITWVLWILLGWLGAHRFYLGRWVSGFVYLGTLGLVGVGVLVDAFFLPMMVRDANARRSARWLG